MRAHRRNVVSANTSRQYRPDASQAHEPELLNLIVEDGVVVAQVFLPRDGYAAWFVGHDPTGSKLPDPGVH